MLARTREGGACNGHSGCVEKKTKQQAISSSRHDNRLVMNVWIRRASGTDHVSRKNATVHHRTMERILGVLFPIMHQAIHALSLGLLNIWPRLSAIAPVLHRLNTITPDQPTEMNKAMLSGINKTDSVSRSGPARTMIFNAPATRCIAKLEMFGDTGQEARPRMGTSHRACMALPYGLQLSDAP